jgi:ribulose-5-phosphate 4-epimerase/fuculose-1-phosphate aldolase
MIFEESLLVLNRACFSDFNYVQGAAGNLSYRAAPYAESLLIKISGRWLRGCSVDDFTTINRHELWSERGEIRPSMEYQLHQFLESTFVLHLHPIDACSILCRKDADLLVRQDPLLRQFPLASYAAPGEELADEVRRVSTPDASVTMLKNHGLIIAADSIWSLLETLEKCSTRFHAIAGYLGAKLNVDSQGDFELFAPTLLNFREEGWGYLTPDEAVFLSTAELRAHIHGGKCFSITGLEQLRFAFALYSSVNFDPTKLQFISPELVAAFVDSDSERFRKRRNS